MDLKFEPKLYDTHMCSLENLNWIETSGIEEKLITPK